MEFNVYSIIKEKVKEILRVEGSWLCPRRLRFFYMQSSKKSMIHVLHAYGRHLSLDNQSCTKRPLLLIFVIQFWPNKNIVWISYFKNEIDIFLLFCLSILHNLDMKIWKKKPIKSRIL